MGKKKPRQQISHESRGVDRKKKKEEYMVAEEERKEGRRRRYGATAELQRKRRSSKLSMEKKRDRLAREPGFLPEI